jgi:NAD+ diphosphatase
MTPSRFQPGHEPPGPPQADALLFVARGLDVLVHAQDEAVRVPTLHEVQGLADGLHFLGLLDGAPVWAAPLAAGREPAAPLALVNARSLFSRLDEEHFALAGRALAVAEWDITHRFCGRCATPTVLVPGERARRCPACHTPFYPRIAPAVIALIEQGDRVLLARAATFPRPWFSALAGFVEPGETLEETVVREVREEVGIEVTDVRYFGSQPWPFGRSLMVGFTARHAAGEVRVDGQEIVEAHWFSADRMPQVPPPISIARRLIDAWLARQAALRGG